MPNVNNLNVRLLDDHLDVEDHGGKGNNNVDASDHPTTINWLLTGELAKGRFRPVTPEGVKDPGFEWKQTPPAGFFDPPSIGAQGNSLSILDHHLTGNDSNGSWIYMLRVDYKGKTYSTTSSRGIGMTVHDPVIINR